MTNLHRPYIFTVEMLLVIRSTIHIFLFFVPLIACGPGNKDDNTCGYKQRARMDKRGDGEARVQS